METFSTYYEKEMGPALSKRFVAFSRPVPMDGSPTASWPRRRWKNRLRPIGAAPFNIDPGLVTAYSVVLSTSKNHAHRIYLRDGVFRGGCLIFRHEKLQSALDLSGLIGATPALDFFCRVRSLRKKSRVDA